LVVWSNDWQLCINTSKTKVLYLGLHNQHVVYRINNIEILHSDHVRDLGVELDENFNFNFHVNNIIKSAYQRLAILFRGFSSRDPTVLTLAYKVYVRPILEYCSEIWSPYLLKHINVLENVQRFFTRKIGNLKVYEYSDRLFILNLESLEIRRLKKDLIMYYKIIHGLIDLNMNEFFLIDNDMYTRGHNFKICKPPCKSDLFSNSFANRVINCWNLLPSTVVNMNSIKGFSAKLDSINFDKFIKGRALV